MFSPVKAIIAGALVFALGGLFIIGQPFGQQSATQPGAQSPAADIPVGPGVTYFTGTAKCTSERGDSTMVDGVMQVPLHSSCALTTTEDRLSGTLEVDNTVYGYGTKGGPWVSESELTTNEGSWRGTGHGVYDSYGDSPLGAAGMVFRYGEIDYIGEGAYDGLVAHYSLAGTDELSSLTGWIASTE